MQYYWHVITTPEGWETLTKQNVSYPTSFPVLAGCVQLSDTEFVVCPLPVTDIPNLLASVPIGIQYHGHVSHQDTQAAEETVTQDITTYRNAAFPLTNPPDDTK